MLSDALGNAFYVSHELTKKEKRAVRVPKKKASYVLLSTTSSTSRVI